ncbi:unnamed protein product [Heterobilharzia americana]|nr:unnamed protein product [Heterobilharzia americana]
MLAENEKARVEAMLQKLDRLKQTSGAKTNEECSLCRKEFGHLSNLPIVCVECGRCVCTACCIELTIPTLYRQPVTKRNSLLNFQWMVNTHVSGSLMNTPKHQTYATINKSQTNGGTTQNNTTNLPASSNTSNNKFSNRRGSLIGTLNSAAFHSQQLFEKVRVKTNSRQSDSHSFVCKICYEAREIWKRSGAWFYKSLPRRQMISCPSSPSLTCAHSDCQTLNNLSDLVKPIRSNIDHNSHTDYTDNDSEQWIQLKPSRRPSKPEGSESIGSSVPGTSKDAGQSEVNSSTKVRCATKKLQKSPEHVTYVPTNQNLTEFSKPNSPSYTNVSGSLNNQDISYIAPSCLLPDSPSPTSSWKAQSVSPISAVPFHPAFTPNKTVSHSTASALASSFTSTNSTQKVASLTGEKEPANLLSTVSNTVSLMRRPTVSASDEAPFGVLYFTLYHDTLNKQLHVAIHKAKNLIAMDANGLSDPYVVCQLLPTSHNSPTPRTSTRPQCLNPVWNEALTFEPFDGKNINTKTLRLAVLDEDLYGSDWLGEYRLQLSQLIPNRLTDFAVPLGPRKPVQRGEYDLACPTRGKIHLGLGYLEDRKQLYVEVIRCADLAPMDPNGFSDPFVKLYLRPDKTKKTKQKTQIKKATLFPEFHETFFYDLNASEAGSRTLEVTVWDFDRGPSNDFIGGLTLGAGAKAERRELWLAVFRPPYRRIEAWFQLSNRNENGNQFTTPGVCD